MRAEGLWFEDCGLIIRAEDTIFRVSGAILAVQSTIFRDMLSLPTPENQETLDGCPQVFLRRCLAFSPGSVLLRVRLT